MDLDGDIRGVDEECLQILDVFVDPSGLVAVWPGDNNVLRVTLVEPVPFLIAEDVEVEHVERLEVGFNGGRLGLTRRRRGLGSRGWGRRGRGHAGRAKAARRPRRGGGGEIADGAAPMGSAC